MGETFRAQVAGFFHVRPDAIFQFAGFLMANIAVDLKYIAHLTGICLFEEAQGRTMAVLRDLQHIAEVDFGSVFCLDEAHIQVGEVVRAVVEAAPRETDNDIGIVLLRLDVELAVTTAGRHLLAYLLNSIATRGAVAHDFPLLQQGSLRVKINTYMREAA